MLLTSFFLSLCVLPYPMEANPQPIMPSHLYTSQPSKAERIDRLLHAYADKRLFNGSILVAKKGKILFKKGYGQANMEWNIPNSPTTRFRIGSITKQFTAVLVLQLKQAGKIDLQAKVSDYLPWYRKNTGGKITIHHLLTHTSGLPNYTERQDFIAQVSKEEIPAKDLAERYCMGDLESEPGTKFKYNNSGYFLLGVIIEAITKKPYAEVVKEQITDIVGMKNTGIDSPLVVLPGRADGYDYGFEGFQHASFINMASSVLSAGALYSTVEDLLLWQTALHKGKLLSPENQALLFSPNLNHYGYGIYINKSTLPGTNKEVTAIGHPGGISGFSAFMIRYVEDETDIIALDNTTSGRRGSLDEMSLGIFSILQDLPPAQPKQPIAVAITEKIKTSNVNDAIAFYRHLKSTQQAQYDFTRAESFLNNFGYYLLQKGRVKDSLVILKLGTEEYPLSANTYDSYAEALLADGQKDLAIQNYKRSLELDPKNTNAVEQLKKITLQ